MEITVDSDTLKIDSGVLKAAATLLLKRDTVIKLDIDDVEKREQFKSRNMEMTLYVDVTKPVDEQEKKHFTRTMRALTGRKWAYTEEKATPRFEAHIPRNDVVRIIRALGEQHAGRIKDTIGPSELRPVDQLRLDMTKEIVPLSDRVVETYQVLYNDARKKHKLSEVDFTPPQKNSPPLSPAAAEVSADELVKTQPLNNAKERSGRDL